MISKPQSGSIPAAVQYWLASGEFWAWGRGAFLPKIHPKNYFEIVLEIAELIRAGIFWFDNFAVASHHTAA